MSADLDKQKMESLLDKIWQNPALRLATLDKKENQVLSFIHENEGNLKKAFATPDYFPHLNWDQCKRLLVATLIEKVLASIDKTLNEILPHLLQDQFLGQLGIAGGLDAQSLRLYILELAASKSSRDYYLIILQAIRINLFARYVPEALERRKTIYVELVRRDRLKVEDIFVPSYLKLASLFAPLFFRSFEFAGGSFSPDQTKKNKNKYSEVVKQAVGEVREKIGNLPEELITAGIDSGLSSQDVPDLGGSSRVISIVLARAREFNPFQKQDRGADTPDKSWFSINRVNAKYYGFDPNVMDELFQIAADKGY